MNEDRTACDTESTAQSRTNHIHRILVVDDDSGVREFGVEVPQSSGMWFNFYATSDGQRLAANAGGAVHFFVV